MRNNDDGAHAHNSSRGARSSRFLPSSIRAISSYLKNVSSTASNLASTARSVGVSVASPNSLSEQEQLCEQVQWAGFDKLYLSPTDVRHVLLLVYSIGFQVWDVEDADDVRELVSRRDCHVCFLHVQPWPCTEETSQVDMASRPLLLAVTGDANNRSASAGSNAYLGNNFVPNAICFYSLGLNRYVDSLRFQTAIHAVRCSSRIIAVALASQVRCYDAGTLQSKFSVLTYPLSQVISCGATMGYGAIAVGPRWLAYAGNQRRVSYNGRVSPQNLTPSPGVSPSTSPANGNLLAYYSKESSKHIAAGIVTLGEMGYKTLSRYCSDLLSDGGSSSGSSSPTCSPNTNNGMGAYNHESEYAGTVIVRDFVNNSVVAQFRAHSSPISALCFDPSGTLLVTASVTGQNLNVFRLMPSHATGTASHYSDMNASHVHLYKLCRGLTNAVIQNITFSNDSHWVAVTSSRGTSHLFAISPFGGPIGPKTHITATSDNVVHVPTLPWWSSAHLARLSQQQQGLTTPPPVVTLSASSRIKNGNHGWRGTATGATTATTGITAPVAVMFHDGGNRIGLENADSCLKDQLWVLSPSTHLIRYAVRSFVVAKGAHPKNGFTSVGTVGPQELRVIVEPLQKWDVCRRLDWTEREGSIGSFSSSYGANTECARGIENEAESGRATGETHRWYLPNAEVQMHQSGLPIWSKSEFFFHVFTEPARDELLGGELEVEKFPTRMVEIRRKDLVPVFERLKNLNTAQDTRESSLENSLRSVALHAPPAAKDCSPDGVGKTSSQTLNDETGYRSHGRLVVTQHNSSTCYDHQGSSSNCPEPIGCPDKEQQSSVFGGKSLSHISGNYLDGMSSDLAYVTVEPSLIDVSMSGGKGHGIMPNGFDTYKRIADNNLTNSGSGGTQRRASVLPFDAAAEAQAILVQGDSDYHMLTLGNCDSSSQEFIPDFGGRDAILNQSSGNFNAVAEDAESVDASSKNEDFESGEQRDDEWEGSIFPFADDG